jgi:predicted phosphodiesterase
MRSPRSARIAILADVHANLPALSAVLADAQQRGCERVYHAGDLIAIGPYPVEVVDLARASGMICVPGNHEAWVTTGLPPDPVPGLQDDGELMHQHWTHSRLDRARRDFIRGLPWAISETIQGVRLAVVHFALAAAIRQNHPRQGRLSTPDLRLSSVTVVQSEPDSLKTAQNCNFGTRAD